MNPVQKWTTTTTVVINYCCYNYYTMCVPGALHRKKIKVRFLFQGDYDLEVSHTRTRTRAHTKQGRESVKGRGEVLFSSIQLHIQVDASLFR